MKNIIGKLEIKSTNLPSKFTINQVNVYNNSKQPVLLMTSL